MNKEQKEVIVAPNKIKEKKINPFLPSINPETKPKACSI